MLPFLVRLACVKRAASVDSEPGSNSRLILLSLSIALVELGLSEVQNCVQPDFQGSLRTGWASFRKPRRPQASMPFRPHFASLDVWSGDWFGRILRKLVKSFWKAYCLPDTVSRARPLECRFPILPPHRSTRNCLSALSSRGSLTRALCPYDSLTNPKRLCNFPVTVSRLLPRFRRLAQNIKPPKASATTFR